MTVAAVQNWTGLEARALRLAMRMSVRAFAEHLGVGVRTISKWEKLLDRTEPRPDTQAILDTALARADAAVHLRFETGLSGPGGPIRGRSRRTALTGPRAWDHESWADDLDRAVVALSRQNFPLAEHALRPWLGPVTPAELDRQGLCLFARSTALLGDLRRDRGSLLGPLSAHHAYRTAYDLYSQLGNPRRLAQTELLLALVDEMSWNLGTAIRAYERLAADERLSRRDRARSMLWLGRALSKAGGHDRAVSVMTCAAHEFDDLGEPDNWSVAQQKIALALRGSGDLRGAFRHIDRGRSGAPDQSAMQRVRWGTAFAHILVSDPATREAGRSALCDAARVAGAYGLGHQLRSIESIRRASGEASAACCRTRRSHDATGSTSAGARVVHADR